MPAIDGLITGIDSSSIIEGLLAIKKRQVTLLETKKAGLVAQKTAFQGIEARLLSFRSTTAQLSRTQNSVFDARSVSVSNESFVAASASSKAATGVYQIRVDALARAHQVAALGMADPDSEITQGTLDIRVGSGAVTTLTIDQTNNTLQGLADAINNANTSVSASLVKDGSGGATPYRLLLTSKQSGADNEISLTNNLAAAAGGAVRPEFDFDNPVQAASDASVSLGSGPGAITVTSSNNRIDDLISGVTLDLLKADNTQDISLTVASNTEPATAAIQKFVDDFNGLMSYIDDQVRFESETGKAGVLIGNRSAIQLQNDVRRMVLDVVPGVGTQSNRVSTIGISVTDKGRLTLNESRLQSVLRGEVAGVTSGDVNRLFALGGQSNHPQVQFLLGSSRTQASTTPYEVDLTQAPERATITAGSPLVDSIVIDGTNNTLDLNLDGAALSGLTLNAGTYTRAGLVAHLQSVINAGVAGRSVTIGLEADALRLTSDQYGLASRVSITGGSALATLGLTGTETDNGVDVAGSYIVNGQTEAATGRGRVLSGNLENEHTADLQVRVTLSPAQIVAGSEASLTVTRGVAARLDKLLGSLLDPVNGRIKQVDDRFDESVADIDNTIKKQNARFDAEQASLIRQFTALESAVNQLQTTSSFLNSQLASLGSLKSSSK